MKGHKPGGGIASRQHVEKPIRTGAGARGVNKNWVSQIGGSQGNHITERAELLHGVRKAGPYGGPSFKPVPLGNELVNSVGAGGPGKGRVLYGQSGSQQQYGRANPGNPAPKGELFPGWPAKR